MPGKLLAAVVLVTTALTTSAVPTVVHSAEEGHGTSVTDFNQPAAAAAKLLAPPPGGWSVPSRRSYYLEASCQPYAATIRAGATAWPG